MKIKVLSALVIFGTTFTCTVNAQENTNTLTLGYAQTKIKANGSSPDHDPRGINLKYRYEFNDTWGVVGGLTYTRSETDYYYGARKVGSLDMDYFSAAAGPSFRLNDYISVYGLVGVARDKAKADFMGLSKSVTKNGAAFSVGLQVNPLPNWVIDASYEYAKASEVKNGTWVLGAGYRF